MRAAGSVLDVGVMTLSRMNRPLVLTAWFVTDAVFPRAWTTVVKFVPSLETWMSKSLVFQVVDSLPAPACRTVNFAMFCTDPRSTWRNLVPVTSEHHLSPVPPDTEPLTALSGVSPLLHDVEPVAGRFSARLPLGGGGGGVPPES